MHYLLFYEVGEDYAARRAEFRDAHLKKAWEASARGELVLGEALADPVDGAVLLFQGESSEVAANFARTDPYVTGGAVKRWHVREWTTVAGNDAAMPVAPREAVGGSGAAGASASPPLENPGRPPKAGIVRVWKGRSTAERAGDYARHATGKVFPSLRAIDGHCEAYLLRRAVGGDIEFVVLTLWTSMDAVRKFAEGDPERAVVDPEARAVLTTFDEFVEHFEVVESSRSGTR
jgi:heme-degrading monooxygenase HmoA/uncharacterized protein YciI